MQSLRTRETSWTTAKDPDGRTDGEYCSRRMEEQRQISYQCETDCAAIEPALTKIGLTALIMDTVTGDSPHFCMKNSPKNLMVMPARHTRKAQHIDNLTIVGFLGCHIMQHYAYSSEAACSHQMPKTQ